MMFACELSAIVVPCRSRIPHVWPGNRHSPEGGGGSPSHHLLLRTFWMYAVIARHLICSSLNVSVTPQICLA
jgi:hypothetical protein